MGCVAWQAMFPETERVYFVQAIRHVTWARVCSGMGMLDWEADLDIVKPDIFFVNEDGDKPGKREACEKRGIKYQVTPLPAPRQPPPCTHARTVIVVAAVHGSSTWNAV